MNRIFLFDMDGTLTPPRKLAPTWIGHYLARLSEYGKIGIVSGSGFDYLISQCQPIWTGISPCRRSNITLLPCNGTQKYSWKPDGWKSDSLNSIRDKIGNENYQSLIRGILYLQEKALSDDEFLRDIDVVGNFISYRESLINWSMIGRDAKDKDREAFIKADYDRNIRPRLLEFLNENILSRLTCNVIGSLGGDTSIDIYPEGWDKTYALKYFNDFECWFVGDKCTESGNDRTIYETLKKSKTSFQTKGPLETIDIISRIIETLEE